MLTNCGYTHGIYITKMLTSYIVLMCTCSPSTSWAAVEKLDDARLLVIDECT